MKNVKTFSFWKWIMSFLTLALAVVAFLTMTSVAMAADGDVTSMTLKDSNANGKIDQVELVIAYANSGGSGAACTAVAHTTNEATTITKITVTDAVSSNPVTVSSITWVSAAAGVSCTIRFNLSEADADLRVNTSATAQNVVYTGPTDLQVRDGSADPGYPAIVATIASGATEVDGAAPAYVSSAYKDISGDGTIDRLDITFSENVTLDEWDDADWTIVGGTVVLTNETAGVASTTDVRLTVSATASTTGGASDPTVAYTAAGGTANSVNDGTNNTGNISAQNISDGAAPVILSGVYQDLTDDGKVETVALTTSTDTGLICTAYTQALTVGTAGTITLASAAGDSCADNNTNQFTITMATGGASNVTGGTTATVVTYTQPGNGLEDAVGNDVPTKTSLTLTDNAEPVVTAVDFKTNTISTIVYNAIQITYTEAIEVSRDGGGDVDIAANASAASTATLGAMTTALTLAGIGTWNGTSNMTTIAATDNTVALDSTGKILTISFNTAVGSYFNAGSTAPTTPTFTPTADAADIADSANNAVNTATKTATNTVAWDVTKPTITSVTLAEDAAKVNGRIDKATVVFNSAIKDASITAANATLGAGAGAFTTGTANDATTVFDLTSDALYINTEATAADFLYSGATTKITDLAGNLLDTTTDGTIIAGDITETDGAAPVLAGVWINQFIDYGDWAATAQGTNGTASEVSLTTEDSSSPQEGYEMTKWVDTSMAASDGFTKDFEDFTLYDTTNDLYEYTQVKLYIYYEDNSHDSTTISSDTELAFIINDSANFTTASEWYITTDLSEGAWTEVTVNLTAAVRDGTTALASLTSNPQYWGIKVVTPSQLANNDALYVDNIRFSRGASSKSNTVTFSYSEAVKFTSGDVTNGASVASNSTRGDLTTNKTFTGFGAFASGTFATKTGTNTVLKATDGQTYMITLADRSGGLIILPSPVTLSGLFTPTANILDLNDIAIAITSTHTPETVIDALDLTTAATAVTDFRPTLITGGQVRFGWTSPSQTAATFSHYVVMYGTAAGAGVATSLWDESNQAALATAATTEATVTGLTDGTTYYFNIAGVDTKGIPTALVTEKSALPSAASGSKAETTAPAVPTGLAATINDSGKVVLTWTDPTDSDLSYVQLAKSIGTDVAPASILTKVNAGVKTYTDNGVNIGDIANYKINAVDKNGNASAFSSVVSVTVKIGGEAEAIEEEVVVEEEQPAEEEAVTEEEVVIGEEETGGTEEITGGGAVEEEFGEIEVTTESGATLTLTDVSSHWAETKIAAMTEKEIVKGNPDGSFKPNANLNRAEGSALLYRVLGLSEPTAPLTAPFSDVAKTSWYAGYVTKLKTLAIVTGNPNGTYKPANNINRAEFLTLAMKTYYYLADEAGKAEIDALKAGAKTTAYKDLKDTWYTTTVTAATGLGFVEGSSCTGGICFNAEASITRAEATTILYNMFYDLL